jgi:hypothetical protein
MVGINRDFVFWIDFGGFTFGKDAGNPVKRNGVPDGDDKSDEVDSLLLGAQPCAPGE